MVALSVSDTRIRWGSRRILAASVVALVACWDDSLAPAGFLSLSIRGPAMIQMAIGTGQQLVLVSRGPGGEEVPVQGTWQSSDANVVSVDTWGVIRARGYGEATIWGRHDGRTAALVVRTRPTGMRVRVSGATPPLIQGEQYDVVAEFLDANLAPVRVPWEVAWTVTTGALVTYPQGERSQRITVRPSRSGTIEVSVTSGDLGARLPLRVLSLDDDFLNIRSFVVFRHFNPTIGWWYAPDLIVSSPVAVTVTQLEFAGVAPVCGLAPLAGDVATPLFDFQPYQFIWVGEQIALGTHVEVAITVKFPSGRTRVQRAVGPVVAYVNVIDHGTDGFEWLPCS